MTSIFESEEIHVTSLDDVRSTTLFKKLLHAEAAKNNIPKTKIHITTSTNIPDGGIDASVDTDKSPSDGLLITGKTEFQLKADSSFKPWNDAPIRWELFVGGKPLKSNLKPEIKACLDEGRYVVVDFRHPITPRDYRKAIVLLKKYLKKCGYAKPKVDVLGANDIAALLQSYPSLVLELKRIEYPSFRNHESWSLDRDMTNELVKTKEYDKKIKEIQKILENKDAAKHIRIIAESGIGKTRFVLEITRNERFSSLVIYTKANDQRLSDLIAHILSNDIHIILVIDDCNQRLENDIWNSLSTRGSRIKLITIFNETTEPKDGSDILYPDTPKLSDSEIEQILTSSTYQIPSDDAKKWAKFAGGYPRFAHLLGVNLKQYPEDVSRSVDNIYNRLFAGNDPPDGDISKKRRKIIRFLSLFKRFGYRGDFEVEAKAIFALAKKVCSDLTWSQFKEIVDWFVSRNLIQGGSTLYISVPILQIAMWKEWWEKYSDDVTLNDIFKKIPASYELRGWFYDMCKYAAESQRTTEIVKFLLGTSGPFKKINLIEDPGGSRFFLALASSMPKEALECLEITIGKRSRKQLLKFKTGRRESIYALEKAAVHESLFTRSANMLLMLAEAENETWSNNASGVFTSLFSLGHGKVAPTAAPPKKRLSVLIDSLNSKSKIKRNLAIKACDTALETRHFTRMAGAEEQGLKEIELWIPESRKEIIEAYDDILKLLMKNLKVLKKDGKDLAVQTICNKMRSIILIPEFTDKVVYMLTNIHKNFGYDEQLLGTITNILEFENKNLKQQTKKKLQKLESNIVGKDYGSLMKRYVAMHPKIDQFKRGVDFDKVREKEIKKLVKFSVEKNNLNNELKWLVTEDAQNGYQFGWELGKFDTKIQFLGMIKDAQKKVTAGHSTAFLGGYFRALFDGNRPEWENQIIFLAKDSKLKKLVIEITLRSGLSDKVGLLLLKLAKNKEFPTTLFANFKFGSVILDLSENVFLKWVEFLLKQKDQKIIFTILDLYYTYFVHRQDKKLPVDRTLSILTDDRILKKDPNVTFNSMDEYHWTGIAKEIIKQNPSIAFDLASKILEYFDSSFFGHYNSDSQVLLNEISVSNPVEMWKMVSKLIVIPMDKKTYHVRHWLRTAFFIFDVPFENISKWIKKDIKNRAWFMAYSIPPILNNDENNLVKKMLIHFGNRDDVRRNLIANLDTEVFSGSASSHYSSKKAILNKFKEFESHFNILSWADWYVSILEKDIERGKAKEEREF